MKAIFNSVFCQNKASNARSTKRSLDFSESTSKSSKKNAKENTLIKIQFLSQITIKIEIPQDNAAKSTFSWLLEETKRKLRELDKAGKQGAEISRIVGLRTADGLLSLDYLLTIPEKTVEVFPKKITLQTIVAPMIEGNDKDHLNGLHNFDLCGCLGKGASAWIYLARSKQDGKFYAIKQLCKRGLNSKRIQRVLDEKDIMVMARDVGIASLYATFQTDEFFYLVIHFCPGGDMLTYLKDHGALSEQAAKHYVKRTLRILKGLHAKGIIHRDIKTNNLLLDLEGKAYLADFGLSKHMQSEDLNFSICGTFKYCAPEVIQNKGYSFPVDYYNVGTLAFEILMGESPFKPKKNVEDLFSDIIQRDIHIPSSLSLNCQDFLRQLLKKDPAKRLGAKGIDEILSHPWLQDAPRVAPINISYFSIDKLVRPLTPEADSQILIDSKNWFVQNSRKLARRSTHIEGFSFHSIDHERGLSLKNLLDEDDSSKKPVFQITREAGTLTTIPNLNSKTELAVERLDSQTRKPRKASSSNQLFECDLSPIDEQESIIDLYELDENENSKIGIDPKRLYNFRPHSSLKK